MKVEDVIENSEYVNSGLYHSNNQNYDELYTKPTNKDRIPKDTPLFIHNYLNELSKKKFRVPIRNGFFATTSDDTGYGRSVYDVMINPSTTRIFVNPEVSDFTQDFNLSETTVASNLIEKANSLLKGSEYQALKGNLNNHVLYSGSTSFDKLLSLIFKDADSSISDSALIERYKDAMNKVIERIKGLCCGYMDNVLEISVDNIKKYGEEYPEYMLYCTGKIKLMRTVS